MFLNINMSQTKKISLSISLIGIIVLLILANILEPKLKNINEITNGDINKKIKLQGKISEIKNYDNLQILTLTKNSFFIDVVLYEKSNFSKQEEILVIGKINKYKKNLQIIADTIKSTSSTSHFPE